jgi:hypothetical protein
MRSDTALGLAWVTLASLAAAHCGGSPPGEDAWVDESDGAATGGAGGVGGAGGAKAGVGGSAGRGGTAGGAGGSGTPASGGTKGSGGSAGGAVVGGGGGASSGGWTNVSPAGKTVSGVAVNRLTGDLFADVDKEGIWKSTDQGATYTQVDNGTVGGIAVIGPGFDVDQDNPKRLAVWSLDGTAGWTSDGSTWREMTGIGRNWDFGATDWATQDPQIMLGALHESGGDVYLSKDGAITWDKLSITVLASGGGWPPPAFAMVGVMDATTLLYSNGDGIYRSTDTGSSFTQVSAYKPETRVPVLFKGTFYLGGAQGLMVSKDKGLTWQIQGSARSMWVGPLFGADENSMVVEDNKAVYKSVDAGATWAKVADLPTDTKYDPQVWGGCAWDPRSNVVYISAVGTPLLKQKLAK